MVTKSDLQTLKNKVQADRTEVLERFDKMNAVSNAISAQLNPLVNYVDLVKIELATLKKEVNSIKAGKTFPSASTGFSGKLQELEQGVKKFKN